MKKYRTLILAKKDVAGLADEKGAIRAVECAFREYGLGRVQMPPKIYLYLKKYDGDFRAMPAYIERLGKCSLKWVNVHTKNRALGLPAVMAVMILSDPKNGFPLCIMDGTLATSLRTGAAGAVAAKYLARKDSKVAGMVGCGAQARAQLGCLLQVFDIREVNVWGHKEAIVKEFIRDMKKRGIKFAASKNIKDCVKDADIIVTTTPSRNPIVKAGWVKKGAHINAIGADAKGKQELDPAILRKAKIVVDSWEQASHSGEINVPLRMGLISKKDIYSDIGKVATGKKCGRTSADEITVFDSTGLAIQDVAIADMIYKAALRKRSGSMIDLVGM